ncbi:kinetochore protein Nuf2 [Cyprinodon tularosa]|uniref:kinetochore protein Nuf2 n=1 Tax=Cyprinodon tularosa TaxID=77115 RepID=UPI0018E254C2|nr:kinetochore protein Nuf2 [Cyprinodon tularosa]
MADNTFPVYDVDFIVNYYRNEVLTGQEARKVSKGDLSPVPKPEVVQTIYMRVLYLVSRFGPECHSMVPLSEDIQNPTYHEGAAAILSLFNRMKQFLQMCLMYDFSLNDLLAPKKQRTLVILSAIMNFLKFRKERLERMLETRAVLRAAKEKQELFNKGIRDLEKKIQLLTTIPPEQQAEAERLAADLSELQANIRQEYKEGNAISESVAELKAKMAEKQQRLAQVKVEVGELKEEITKIKSQIVESPEELKSQMEKMRETVKNIKKSITDTDECVMEMQNRVESVKHAEAQFQQLIVLLQDLERGLNANKQLQDEYQMLVSQNEKMEKEMKNLCIEETQLKEALDIRRDKECKQSIRRQKRREMKEQHVQGVLGQCDQIHQKREEMADKIQQINGETQQMKANIKSLREVCSIETEKAQVLYDTLMASIDELNKKIEVHLEDLKLNLSKYSDSI